MMRKLLSVFLCSSLAFVLSAQKHKTKKGEEPPTQVLQVPPEPPDAIAAETSRLSFQISPLSSKGLLSQQIRDALKVLVRDAHGAQIVKLRAFVAGSGDLRRVQTIVTEEFTEQKRPLPVISTIQVGELPMVGAQVVIEATSIDRHSQNPNGLAFLSGIPSPTIDQAIAELGNGARAAGLHPSDVLRVTCFLNAIEDEPRARSVLSGSYPGALLDFLQRQRQGVEPISACEAVGRLHQAPPAEVAITPQGAVLNPPRLVFTGAKLMFRDQDSDFRLAVQRLSKALEPLSASPKDVAWVGVYALTQPRVAQIRSLDAEIFDAVRSPAGTLLLFEGLPSTDATAAIEWIAAAR